MIRILVALIGAAGGIAGAAILARTYRHVGATLLPGRSAVPHVVFVGRSFVINRGVLGDFDRLAAGRFKSYPPPLLADFDSVEPPDPTRMLREIRRSRAGAVVLQGFQRDDTALGWQDRLARNLTVMADAAQRAGVRVVLAAHPAPKPTLSLGYRAKAGQIDRVVAGVAEETGAQVGRVGMLFAAFAHGDRARLFADRGLVWSGLGDLAVALSIADALGVMPAVALADVTRPPEPGFYESWPDHLAALRPATGRADTPQPAR